MEFQFFVPDNLYLNGVQICPGTRVLNCAHTYIHAKTLTHAPPHTHQRSRVVCEFVKVAEKGGGERRETLSCVKQGRKKKKKKKGETLT